MTLITLALFTSGVASESTFVPHIGNAFAQQMQGMAGGGGMEHGGQGGMQGMAGGGGMEHGGQGGMQGMAGGGMSGMGGMAGGGGMAAWYSWYD